MGSSGGNPGSRAGEDPRKALLRCDQISFAKHLCKHFGRDKICT